MLPNISVINFSPKLKDHDVQEAIRAVNRQIAEDFVPIWGNGRSLILHAASFNPLELASLMQEPVRASGVVYLVDEATLPGALGYHDVNARDIPVGFVFVLNHNDWTVTLSHEVLEMIIDPTINLFAPGPHPLDPNKTVLHTYEVCDAVERTSYQIDGIELSNFLTPSYFTIGDAPGTRNDFLGVGVDSFSVTKDSHIAFFDLASASGEFVTVIGKLASRLTVPAARAKMYDHPKPRRPYDEELMESLQGYRKGLPREVKDLSGTGLPQLLGITRTSRYQAACLAIAKQMPALKGKRIAPEPSVEKPRPKDVEV